MEKYTFHALRFVTALILFQTLFFKFSGAAESIFIFSTLGVEPWGRYLSGIVELIACLFLLIPRFAWLGAGISALVMMGAILSHFLFLGIVVNEDSGLLFVLALVVLLFSLYLLFRERNKIPFLKLI